MRQLIEKVYANEGDILQKKNEISEMQKILSDSHIGLYDERQQLLKLQREYDSYASKNMS